MTWLALLFCLLFRRGVLHGVLLVVSWCCILFSSGFLCVSSRYLVLPGVSSLTVYSLGVSAPIPKVQGLISSQEQRFHKWFVMALRESKTNIPKWETKDEPQTNGSYKIRQIIIKMMEYAQYIYTHKQSQNSPTHIKYSKLTWWTKETKNYIYKLRTKLIKAQTGKQN